MRNSKIIRNNHEYVRSERVNWLDEFADNLAKQSARSAVEVARERASQMSIYDQIHSIVDRPTYRTVEGVVQDYQERTGLVNYLQQVLADQKEQKKTASDTPSLDRLGPQLKNDILSFVHNIITTHHGFINIPTVQYEILTNFAQKGVNQDDIYTEDVMQKISQMIAAERAQHPTVENIDQLGRNVGLQDGSEENENDDFMSSVTNKL